MAAALSRWLVRPRGRAAGLRPAGGRHPRRPGQPRLRALPRGRPNGLAHLAETIVDQGGRVELLGLTRHDLRILAYLVGPLVTTQAEPEASD